MRRITSTLGIALVVLILGGCTVMRFVYPPDCDSVWANDSFSCKERPSPVYYPADYTPSSSATFPAYFPTVSH